MIGRREKSTGNLLLYEHLAAKRAPPFLPRNFTRALRVHQLLHTHGDLQGFSGPGSDSRQSWKPPSVDLLNRMVERANLNGSIVLDLHGLDLLAENRAVNASIPGRHPKKLRLLLQAKCKIRVTVIQQSKDSQQTYSAPEHEASLSGADKGHGRDVSIVTEHVIISPKDFGSMRSSFDPKGKVRLLISVNFASEKDAKNVFTHMGLNDVSASTTQLEARLENVLDQALGRISLQLKDVAKKPILGLNASIGRADTLNESILTTIGRRKTGDKRLHLPTPPAEVKRYKVTYQWPNENKKEITVSDLSCFLHPVRCTELIDLQMHLYSMHPHHKYELFNERMDEEGVEYYTFKCRLAEHTSDQRASDRTDDPRDVMVLAPDEPCNVQKVLEGDDHWQRTARQPRQMRQAAFKAAAAVRRTGVAGPQRKLPNEVIARDTRPRKAYVVPKAPAGVTFFQSITKQPLEPGAEVSESDDDVDEEWMRQRKRAEIYKENIPAQTKLFLTEFDIFIRDEHLESDIHLGDAVVRFTREKAQWIRQASLLEQFRSKLDDLLEDNLISRAVHTGCIDLVNASKLPDQANELSQRLTELNVQKATTLSHTSAIPSGSTRPKRARRRKGNAIVADSGQLTPLTIDSDGDVAMRNTALTAGYASQPVSAEEDADPPFDQCYCGEDAFSSTSTSPAIACNSITCIRRTFHQSCVQARSTVPTFDTDNRSWTCDQCKHASRTRT